MVDPHATPNPFAPLVDDAGGDVASHDVQRAPTSVSSVCSSSAAIVSPAPSSVDAKVDDLVAAGPTQPAEVAAKSTASKRACTRSAATAPTHGFFQRLATRPAAVRAHFQQLYPPTSRICPCGLFPVYASKAENVSKLPPELDAFCLQCTCANVLSLGAPIVQAFNNWAPGFVPELEAYYVSFYGAKERKELDKPVTEMEKENGDRRWMRLLERLGFIDRC